MLRKRIIFTLLYDGGSFVLSRNFRLQKVGDLTWLQQNYNFSKTSFYIDELIVLDVSRGERDPAGFCEILKTLTKSCFIPIAAGGGVRSIDHARNLLRSGADKVVINSLLFESPGLVKTLSEEFGRQCLVGSLDIRCLKPNDFQIMINNGSRVVGDSQFNGLEYFPSEYVGEWYVNSINNDGTGRGYELECLNLFPNNWNAPIILAGGAGHQSHFMDGLSDPRVDAVATANLFNFIGNGLANARKFLVSNDIELAQWPPHDGLNDNFL